MISIAFILAAKDKLPPVQDWESLRGAFRHEGDGGTFQTLGWTLALLGMLLVALSAVALVRWFKNRELSSKPLRVFHQFATSFKLPLADEWLLVRIARYERLPSPLTLMLSSATLRHHAQNFARRQPPRRQGKTMNRVKEIDAALFG